MCPLFHLTAIVAVFLRPFFIKQRSHFAAEILKQSIISTVRPTVHIIRHENGLITRTLRKHSSNRRRHLKAERRLFVFELTSRKIF